jgi:hypothetical protein
MKCFLLTILVCAGCASVNAQWSSPDAANTIHNTNQGFVGISNSNPFTPSTLLHLYSTTTVAEQKIQTMGDGYAQFTLQSDQKAYQWSKRPSYEQDALELWYFNGTQWQTSPFLTILPSGSIGIGTTSVGSQKLAVEGSIGARQVIVTTNSWPDFVFDKTYVLPPLDSMANYLRQYRHLPNIPSAAEVTKTGIDLGRNQGLLLQKIEELTLYLLQEHTALQQQQTENERLCSQLKSLEARLDMLEVATRKIKKTACPSNDPAQNSLK